MSAQSRWTRADVPRGDAYDRRFDTLAAGGADVHGEADLVASFGPRSVLDAGCGTGRVAIELARRDIEVVGVDLDPAMLGAAVRKAPELAWVQADLAALDLGRTFDVVLLAGNVMLFVAPGTECQVVARAAAHLGPGGRLVSGFSLGADLDLAAYDAFARAAGLEAEDRWATWDRAPFAPGSPYALSVHRRPG